jgi:D-alanyl-lipoteichoic acid acyltransferase DltB (MBOAT superfamily)
MFYPQLVAGPIERPQNIIPQFRVHQKFTYENLSAGLKMMLWGLFKKVVIADRLSVIVDEIYSGSQSYSGFSLAMVTVLFAVQIYCDFSGYSDIAIGSARVMGYKLIENFRTPFISQTVKEFWDRWHISLSTWFRDYLYIPLGGNRVGKTRRYINLFFVFLVSGFWHGAKWTFVIWGALHGLYVVLTSMIKIKLLPRVNILVSTFKWGLTIFLVCFAFVFFRADSISQAFAIIKRMFYNCTGWSLTHASTSGFVITSMVLLVVFLLSDPVMDKLIKNRAQIKYRQLRMITFAAILVLVVLFGHFNSTSFIYFQF